MNKSLLLTDASSIWGFLSLLPTLPLQNTTSLRGKIKLCPYNFFLLYISFKSNNVCEEKYLPILLFTGKQLFKIWGK